MAENKKGLFSKKPAEMKPTPRKQLPGYLADALINARNFADRARVPESVPLIGGQGLGSMFLGQAPEEVNELSYGNSPIQMNPYAGRTGSYVPEMKRGRGAQMFDALSLLPLPGARTVAGGLFGGGLTPGVDAAATVYHGSPHKFDRFDSSKIGTGEGAQAYGHGLYLAEDRGIADVYRKKLTGVDGAPVGSPNDSLQMKIGRLQFEIDRLRQSGDSSAPAMIRAYESRIKELDGAGSLYKVDLPDEAIARMLDWDKPVGQQQNLRAIQQSAAKVLAEEEAKRLATEAAIKAAPATSFDELFFGLSKGNQEAFDKALSKALAGIDRAPLIAKYQDELAARLGGKDFEGANTGRGAYQSLVRQFGSDKAASDFLRQQGIPGIRYLDGGSRSAGQGSSNYVVFPGNENLLTILERNGQVVAPSYRDPFGNTIDETIR